jgi:hypothetical protein
MDRPTCKTCPYIDEEGADDDGNVGFCRRYPPSLTADSIRALGSGMLSEAQGVVNQESGHWKPRPLFQLWHEKYLPVMRESEFCGEHPDFPAYIAASKTQDHLKA